MSELIVSRLRHAYARARQSIWALSGQLVVSGANFFTTIFLVWVVGVEEFGRFSVCFLLIMIVRSFLNGTVLMPLSAILPKLRDRSKSRYRGFLLANALGFSLASSGVLWALSAVFPWSIGADWLGNFALGIALANALTNMAEFLRRYHFADDRPVVAFWVDASRYCCQVAGLILIYWVAPQSLSAESALYVLAISSAVGALVGCIAYGKMSVVGRMWRAAWRRHWRFIRWMMPGVVLETIQGNAPMLIAGAVLGEAALGVARTCQQLANILNIPSNAFQQTLPAQAARAYSLHGITALSRLIARNIRVISALHCLIILASAVIFVTFGRGVLPEDFSDDGLQIYLIFCVANLVIGIRFAMMVLTQALEIPQYGFYANLIGTICSLAVMLSLIDVIGVVVVPYSILIVSIVTALIYAFVWWRTSAAKGAS